MERVDKREANFRCKGESAQQDLCGCKDETKGNDVTSSSLFLRKRKLRNMR